MFGEGGEAGIQRARKAAGGLRVSDGSEQERVGDRGQKGRWGGESRKAIRNFQSSSSSAASSPST